jgi:flagellar basal-body rod protein FlgC
MEAMKISMSGLDVEWQRLQVIAQNLANMNSTRNEAGDVFRPLRLVSGPSTDFSTLMQGGTAALKPTTVQVLGIEPQADGIRKVYEPTHPNADPDGFVSYPNVDHAGEMTLMIKASRAYEANLTAISIAQSMYSKALDMGRQG